MDTADRSRVGCEEEDTMGGAEKVSTFFIGIRATRGSSMGEIAKDTGDGC